MDRAVVYLPVPRDWDSQKSVQIESITPKPSAINEDPNYGNKMAYFLLPDGIPRNQSREFTVQYTFTFYQTHVLVDPAKVGSYNTSDPNYFKYTRQRPSDWVESDDASIKKTASGIVGGESNPYRKAKLIYDWMVTNIEYKFPSNWGAKQTYLKRGGDCGSQTALFCAMAISQGIPCRAVSGLFLGWQFPRTYSSKGAPSEPDAYGSHVYAEFYLPVYGWVPADTSIGRGSGRPEDYFGSTWDFFSIRSKGFGIQMVPPIPERVWLFPHYAWWFWGDAREYDSYYTYRVEKIENTQTTTATENTQTTSGSSTTTVLTWSLPSVWNEASDGSLNLVGEEGPIAGDLGQPYVDLASVAYGQSNQMLYFRFDLKGEIPNNPTTTRVDSVWYQVLFDVDSDPSTGFHWSNDFTPDYLLELQMKSDGGTFRISSLVVEYSGTGTDWTWASVVQGTERSGSDATLAGGIRQDSFVVACRYQDISASEGSKIRFFARSGILYDGKVYNDFIPDKDAITVTLSDERATVSATTTTTSETTKQLAAALSTEMLALAIVIIVAVFGGVILAFHRKRKRQ